MLLAKSRIPLVATGIIFLVGLALFFMADRASADVMARPSGGIADDVGWDWTYDSRGLQVCINRGDSWTGVASKIDVYLDQQHSAAATLTTIPTANISSCLVLAAVTTAPASVGLDVQNASGGSLAQLKDPVNTSRLIPPDMGWDAQFSGDSVRVRVKLGALLPPIHKIEVYPNHAPGDSPAMTATRTGELALATDQVLNLDVLGHAAKPTSVRLALLNASGALITLATGGSTGVHADQLVSTTPAAPAAVAAPAVTFTETPDADVTLVTEPTGGAVAIVQPSSGGSLGAPDGLVVVSLPIEVYDTTFQLVYNPSPATMPEASARTAVQGAFELNAHDTSGTQITPSLLKSATIKVKYTDADVVAAVGSSPLNLTILRYDTSTAAWSEVNTTVDIASQTLTGKVNRFSLFALRAAPPVEPPATGDHAPGSVLLLAVMLAGVLLVVTGSRYLIQARRNRG